MPDTTFTGFHILMRATIWRVSVSIIPLELLMLYTFVKANVSITITVFIYSMPGYECSVKERMLYSSCQGPLLDVIENRVGIIVSKKVSQLLLFQK